MYLYISFFFFFFKHKTAYELRISDWSSDVCSSDLSSAPADQLTALGKQLAMHVAAANPLALDESGIDPEVIERERAIAREKAAGSGKHAEIVEKMIEGGVRKFVGESTLLGQIFVIDGKTKIAEVLAKRSEESRVGKECVSQCKMWR